MKQSPRDAAAPRTLELAGELQLVIGKLKRRLREEVSAGDFTPSEVSVLLHLEREGPATVTALARVIGMRPQSMGSNVAALESAGMIRGAPDPDDGRQVILTLTAQAREKFRTGRAARESWLYQSIRARLSSQEQDTLGQAVALLKRLVEPG